MLGSAVGRLNEGCQLANLRALQVCDELIPGGDRLFYRRPDLDAAGFAPVHESYYGIR
jgi:hypothetical protein